jgi:hypothetical protein
VELRLLAETQYRCLNFEADETQEQQVRYEVEMKRDYEITCTVAKANSAIESQISNLRPQQKGRCKSQAPFFK